MSLREILKKNNTVHFFGKWFRRAVLHSKYIYLLKTTPGPLSNQYGFDRGTPLDRYFIETFIKKNRESIRGHCLEVRDGNYTKKYGAAAVTISDILDIETNNKQATIIGDLRDLKKIETNTYDCIILTQVLQFIDDFDAAIAESFRVLASRGTLLVTLPALSRADCTSGVGGDFWRFTPAGAQFMFEKHFQTKNIVADFYGNARTGQYFLAGLAVEDVPKKLLMVHDENFPTIVTVKATKHA